LYKVTSGLTPEDYHKNVGKEEFTRSFHNLANILKEKDAEYIIDMEDASYHSSKATPTSMPLRII